MAKKAPKRSYFPARVVIPTLAGGVGRQSQSKRTTTESQNIDNFLISIEHSAEKRRGTAVLTDSGTTLPKFLREVYGDDTAESKDLWFYWYGASGEQRFLIIIDYSADPEGTDDMLWVYRVKSDDTFTLDTAKHMTGTEKRKYLTYGNDTNLAESALRAVAVGSSILVLNTKVKAGYSSLHTDDITWYHQNYAGENDLQDFDAELNYETTVSVDPLGLATAWDENAQYLSEDQVFDRLDPLEEDDDGTTDDHIRYGLWKVKPEATGMVGADDSGLPPRPPSDQITFNVANHTIDVWAVEHEESVTVTPLAGGTPDSNAKGKIQFNHNDSGSYRVASRNDTLTDTADWFTHHATDTGGGDGLPALPDVDGFSLGLKANHIGWGCSIQDGQPDCENYPTGSWGMWFYIVLVDMGDLPDPGATIIRKVGTTGQGGNHHGGGYYHINQATTAYVNCYGITTYAGLAQVIAGAINKMTNYTYDANYAALSNSNRWGSKHDHDTVIHKMTHKATVSSNGTGVDIECLYKPEQWERVYEEDENGDPVGDDPRYTKFIKPSDYTYPDSEKLYLGQTIPKLSDLRFPPTTSAFSARNGAEGQLATLYPDIGHTNPSNNVTGKGKLYYLSQPFLTLSEGHYRVVDIEEQPYLQSIRTPDGMSVIDKKRMPKQLYYDGTDWVVRHVDWDMRTSGTIANNPGPSIFHDSDGNAVQSSITAMSFFRDRLFLSSEDKLISSRLGDWDNLWLFDPSNITVADPIDISVSSNSFTPITYLQPYRTSLFLGTSGDTQYDLLGSENQISPLTAEISPTSFFGMSDHVEPIMMNNNLFFFDTRKLYIYFGEQNNTNQQQALELTTNAPNYLPDNYISPTVSSDKSSLFVVDKDNPNNIYIYTNRVSGTEMLQSAFSRIVLSTRSSIKSIAAYEDFLYIVSEETAAEGVYENMKYLTLTKLPLNNLSLDEPRLDNLTDLGTPPVIIYVPTIDRTVITTAIPTEDVDTLVITSGEFVGATFNFTRVGVPGMPNGTGATLAIEGDHVDVLKSGNLKVGKLYTAEIELSQQFYRDQNAMSVNGTLNLRYGLFRFRNAGNFTVEVARQGRTAKITPFIVSSTDDREVDMSSTSYKGEGLFKVPILGFSDDLSIKVVSNNIHPMSISNIQFQGKFKFKVRTLGG